MSIVQMKPNQEVPFFFYTCFPFKILAFSSHSTESNDSLKSRDVEVAYRVVVLGNVNKPDVTSDLVFEVTFSRGRIRSPSYGTQNSS